MLTLHPGATASPAPLAPVSPPPGAAAPRPDVAFYITAVAIFVIFLIPKLFQHAGAYTGDLDTGIYSNLAWALFHGEGFTGSLLGRHHLGEHFSPVMILVAPLYLLWPSAYVLMILQAAAVALAVVLAIRFADVEFRRAGLVEQAWGDAAARARFGACALLIVLFMLYPPLLATLQAQFQPIELGMPMVVGAIMLMHARRDGWLAVLVLLLLTTRESAPLAVGGLGVYAGLALRRWRLAVLLILVAGAWAAVTMGVAMPYFRTGPRWSHVRHYNPWAMWEQKPKYLAGMLLAFGPLPFLGRRALAATAAAVPGMLLNLSVGRETQFTFVGHYDAQTAPFLMVAAVHGVVAIAPLLRERVRLAASAAAASLAMAVVMFDFTDSRTAFELMDEYYPTQQRREFVAEARAFAARYADAPSLSAWAFIGPQVCHRPRYVALRATAPRYEDRMAWAADRLLPGTILLVPTDQYGGRARRELQLLYFGGRAKLIDRGQWVEAWQWPTDAPPAGTPAALQYVTAGRARALAAMLAATNPAAATQLAMQAATQPATQSVMTPRALRRKRPNR